MIFKPTRHLYLNVQNGFVFWDYVAQRNTPVHVVTKRGELKPYGTKTDFHENNVSNIQRRSQDFFQ